MNGIFLLAHAGETAGWHLPPLHPILVNFTAALIPASVLSDWLGRFLRQPSLAGVGWWTMLYAAIITPFTAAAGWWWMRQMQDMDHWQMPYHQWLGVSLAVVIVALAIWRGRLYRKMRAVSIPYLLVATLAVAALVVQGDLGGQMSFGGDNESDPVEQHDGTPAATAHQHAGDLLAE